MKLLTALRAKHAEGENATWGVDGTKGSFLLLALRFCLICRGVLVDMNELQVWEPLQIKVQSFKTAVEAACMLLRIDEIVSGAKKSVTQMPILRDILIVREVVTACRCLSRQPLKISRCRCRLLVVGKIFFRFSQINTLHTFDLPNYE